MNHHKTHLTLTLTLTLTRRHPRRLHSSAPRSRSTCAGRSSRASWPSARVASRASSTRPSAWPWPRAWESTSPFLGMVFWRPFVSEFAGTAARASRTRAGRCAESLNNPPRTSTLTRTRAFLLQDDGFLECPSEGCAHDSCLDFLLRCGCSLNHRQRSTCLHHALPYSGSARPCCTPTSNKSTTRRVR